MLLMLAITSLSLFTAGSALGVEASAQAGRGFKGKISRDMATTAAAADARLQAMRLAVRELAQKDEVQLFFGGEVMRSAPRPNPLALAWSLLESEKARSAIGGVPPDMQVTVSLELVVASGQSNIDTLRLLLAHSELLEIYARAITLLQDALSAYDAAATPLLKLGLPERQNRQAVDLAEKELVAAYGRLEVAVEYLSLIPSLHKLGFAGSIEDEGGDFLSFLEEAARKAPDSYLILTELARLRLFHGHIPAARKALEQAIDLEPGFAFAYDLRGLVLLWLELPALALMDFSRAIQLEPYHPVFFENRALAHRILEQHEAMCADFFESCRLGECGGLEWARSEGFCGSSWVAPGGGSGLSGQP